MRGPDMRLVVTGGRDTGLHIDVDENVKLVGRARESDLSLSDQSVSRRHFHIRAVGDDRARIELCEEAAPLVCGSSRITDAGDVQLGDTIFVGNSVLLLSEIPATQSGPRPEHDVPTTTVGWAMNGPGVDAVAFAVTFSLTQTLLAATDIGGVEAALVSWARTHAACERVDIHAEGDSSAARLEQSPVFESATANGGTRILLPAPGAPTGWLAFIIKVPPPRVTPSHRRLLIVAAILGGARLGYLWVRKDRDAYRRQAVGSSRAFLGDSQLAANLVRLIQKLATSTVTALLIGETGVGKTFVARQIHEGGPRREKPLQIVNCANIPENLAESELFGHVRGAFTGASSERPGAFEAAGSGTLLLDEIGELPLPIQAKLLRVLEDKQFNRLGSQQPIPLRARVLTATNRDLEAMVKAGTFRSDLYFRISPVVGVVPPLRERGSDIVLLAEQLLADLAESCGRRVQGFSPSAVEAISRYAWPGNVRELRNAIEHAILMGEGAILEASDFPPAMRRPASEQDVLPSDEGRTLVELPMAEEVLQAKNREAAVRLMGGNIKQAAAFLGIGRSTLYKK